MQGQVDGGSGFLERLLEYGGFDVLRFAVFTAFALAEVGADDTLLKTLAVLLLTPRSSTVAPFEVSWLFQIFIRFNNLLFFLNFFKYNLT